MQTKLLRVLAVLLAFTLLGTAACGSDDDDGDGATDGATGDTTDEGGDDPAVPDTFPDFEEPTKGGRLKMVMSDNIDCYSGLSYYGISWSLFYFMARGLYGYANTIEKPESDEVRPDLAAEMPEISDDGLTYTVTLREGLTFPDGRPVTSADVKATYEYMLDPNIQCTTGGPPSSGYYAVIEGVDTYSEAKTADPAAAVDISGIQVVDDLTTSFTLTKPDGAFVRALAMGWSFIVPADTPHELLATPPIHVGPYQITEYVPDEAVKIDREPTWDDNVAAGVPEEDFENNIDGIDLEIGVPDDIALARLKDNEIDISFDSGAPTGSDVPAVANDPQFKDRFYSAADSSLDYGIFRVDKAPFDNALLRQAVNWAVDRATLGRIAGGELSRSPWSEILSSNLMQGSEDETGEVYTFDPEKAEELIEESGVETPIPVVLAHYSDAPGPQLAAAVKESLDAVGFDVTLNGYSADVYHGILTDQASEIDMGYTIWGQDYEDAITFFGPLLTCPGGVATGSNYGFFCDEEFDAQVQEISQMPTGPERTAAWAELSYTTMQDKAPWWPILNRRRPLLVSERLGNFIWGTGKQWYFANYFLRDAG